MNDILKDFIMVNPERPRSRFCIAGNISYVSIYNSKSNFYILFNSCLIKNYKNLFEKYSNISIYYNEKTNLLILRFISSGDPYSYHIFNVSKGKDTSKKINLSRKNYHEKFSSGHYKVIKKEDDSFGEYFIIDLNKKI